MPDTSDDLASQRTAFIEKIGLIAQIDGLPRAAGRVFGLLVWEGEAVAFGELARRLDLSRGSVSSSVRLLEERGVVRRVARTGDRQDWFEMMPDPFSALLEVGAVRIGRAATEIRGTLDDLPPRSRSHAARRSLCPVLRDAGAIAATGGRGSAHDALTSHHAPDIPGPATRGGRLEETCHDEFRDSRGARDLAL